LAAVLDAGSLVSHLERCGYSGELLKRDYHFGREQTVPLVGFAHPPHDARSACVAVLDASGDPEEDVKGCRTVGAPIVFLCREGRLQWWKQGAGQPELLEEVGPQNVRAFFTKHRGHFRPDVVYRAKTWGRLDRQQQLTFVDAGLMPIVERDVGEDIGRLLERGIARVCANLGWQSRRISEAQGQWLFQTAFWLLAAKLLRDKGVRSFQGLDLHDVRECLGRVAEHYGPAAAPPRVGPTEERALRSVAGQFEAFSHLGPVTTESLAYVYENTLISKETRRALGVHSTPQYLVDYVVSRVARLIERDDPARHYVFEPACGHAAFLVGAMRMLGDRLPGEWTPEQRHAHFQETLHGCETDEFARQIALLSLTLADIPNPDGWDILSADMFADARVVSQARQSTILLSNPPFETFTDSETVEYRRRGIPVRYHTKAAEMLARMLPEMPSGSLFGVIVPQGLLHGKNEAPLRERILREYDLSDICLLPDGIFAFSSAESAILVGRKLARETPARRAVVDYRRVREEDRERFKQDYVFSSKRRVPQERCLRQAGFEMRVPELDEVWHACRQLPRLKQIADLGKGLEYRGQESLPKGSTTHSPQAFRGARRGFVHFDSGVELQLHDLPKLYWMNLDKAVISRPRTGREARPQVLWNYGPVRRGPWRLKALLDPVGHPVTSRFVTVRPRTADVPLEYLWALCNSPVANAFADAFLAKRDNLVGTLRKMPVPVTSPAGVAAVKHAAEAYLDAVRREPLVRSKPTEEELKRLLLQMDAEVLKLYDLPPRLERQLLDHFNGYERPGVPFPFDRYYDPDFTPCLPLHEYVSDAYQMATARAWLKRGAEEAPEIVKQAARLAAEIFSE
jgi:hypothetical protein